MQTIRVYLMFGHSVSVSVNEDSTDSDIIKATHEHLDYTVEKPTLYYAEETLAETLAKGKPIFLRGRYPESVWKGVSCQIFVKTLTRLTLTVQVQLEETVNALKDKILGKTGIPADMMRLIFDGMQMEDSKRLIDYGMDRESTLHLVHRLRGGGTAPAAAAELPDINHMQSGRATSISQEDFDKLPLEKQLRCLTCSALNIGFLCPAEHCKAHGLTQYFALDRGKFDFLCDAVQCEFCKIAVRQFSDIAINGTTVAFETQTLHDAAPLRKVFKCQPGEINRIGRTAQKGIKVTDSYKVYRAEILECVAL